MSRVGPGLAVDDQRAAVQYGAFDGVAVGDAAGRRAAGSAVDAAVDLGPYSVATVVACDAGPAPQPAAATAVFFTLITAP